MSSPARSSAVLRGSPSRLSSSRNRAGTSVRRCSRAGVTAAEKIPGSATAARPQRNAAMFSSTDLPLMPMASSMDSAGIGSAPIWWAAPTTRKLAAVVLPKSSSAAVRASKDSRRRATVPTRSSRSASSGCRTDRS